MTRRLIEETTLVVARPSAPPLRVRVFRWVSARRSGTDLWSAAERAVIARLMGARDAAT